MKIQSVTDNTYTDAIQKAVAVLTAGGLVIYPTETCYGLAADATNSQAVKRLLQYKRKREGKPLSVLVASQAEAEQYVVLNYSAKQLYRQFLPGPMTVVSQVRADSQIRPEVTSELNTLGIRISSHPVAMALAQAYPHPVTATSANASWQKKPYTISDIIKPLKARQQLLLDLALDAGPLPKTQASTVVDTTATDTMVLRSGAIQVNDSQSTVSQSEKDTKQFAKRLLLSHWNTLRTHGLVIGLVGNLGVGKTIFAKGVGEFLQISDTIVSPSYSLVQEYAYSRHTVDGMLYHLDPWRLLTAHEFHQLKVDTMIRPNSLVVIEWANRWKSEIIQFCKSAKAVYLEVSITENSQKDRVISYSVIK